MKLAQILLLLVSFSQAPLVSAQALSAEKVPSAVSQAFETKFPGVKSPAWKLKTDKNYEAEFTLKGTEIAAKFDTAGKWLETESAIPPSKLPKAVRKKAATEFKGYKVVETQSLQRWNEKPLTYELHLDNAKEIVKAQFSAEGALLNQSAKAKAGDGKPREAK